MDFRFVILISLIILGTFEVIRTHYKLYQFRTIDRHANDDVIYKRAAILVADKAPLFQTGEYKRHQVYAQLQKDFPDIEHLYLSYAIDRVLLNAKKQVLN